MSLALASHSCPWLREGLSSESLSLASEFFCVLGLSLEPCVLDSTSDVQYTCCCKQYLNCRGGASPLRDLASPHRDLGVHPSRFERWMIRRKDLILHLILAKNCFNFRLRLFFGVDSISATKLRNLH